MAFVTALKVLPSSAQSQRLTANKTWLLPEAAWWAVPNHSCELNISLSTQSCCMEPLSSFLPPLFSLRFPLLPALPGCSLLPVRLCQFGVGGGGCSGCPWRWAGWSILGGVMWDWWDGVVRICRGATGVYCGGPFLEKMEGYSGGQVWPMMGWQVVFESILKSEWQQQKEAVLDCVVKGFRCYWVPLHLLFSNPLIKVLINSV